MRLADAEFAETPVGEFRKNSREVVRVRLSEFEGAHLVDVRAFTLRDNGDPLPTKKGISLRVQQIGALIELLQKAQAEAETRWPAHNEKAAA